jgi:HNH endonuclease
MTVLLKRQLTDEEKKEVLKQHGRKCFATGHPIPESEPLHFDHIKAYSQGFASELDNIAPMCAQHNKGKGTLSLEDFRTKLRLREFFSTGDKLTLGNLLEYLKSKNDIARYGDAVAISESNGHVTVESESRSYVQTLYKCPTTGWKYFYATLDVDVIDSDDDEDHTAGLQPRYLITEKVFDLYRHFQRHPVLQPSVGRIVNSHIRLFDGQHKVAALLWNGRRLFECKIYFEPEMRLLNQTNIAAHDKFAQTRFFSSVMVAKLGAQFGVDFDDYKNVEETQPKSEAGFMDYLRRKEDTQSQGQLNTRFRSYLYTSVLEAEESKFKALVSPTNRSTEEKPITMDMLQKSLFAVFLYREPMPHDLTTDAYRREDEIKNLVRLMNLIYDYGLNSWDAKAGMNNETQLRLKRMFRSKSMMAWAGLLHGAICGKLELNDAEDRERPFYRELSEKEIERIANVVKALYSWKRWSSPPNDEIDRILSDNKSEVKDWFRTHGLTTGYLMGAPE